MLQPNIIKIYTVLSLTKMTNFRGVYAGQFIVARIFESENEYYVITLDKAGRISRLYDKVNDREVFTGLANEIQTFEDRPRNYENWEISDFYKQKQWTIDSDAEITPIFDGSTS